MCPSSSSLPTNSPPLGGTGQRCSLLEVLRDAVDKRASLNCEMGTTVQRLGSSLRSRCVGL